MKTLLRYSVLIGVFLLASMAFAQEATDDTEDTTTSTNPTSTVNWFFVACENRAILDLSGTMDSGFDLYVQVFNGLNASGTPLTDQRQVSVNGSYTVTPDLPFTGGQILALGQFASARITIAAEGNPSNTLYTGTTDDVQDGCVEPSYPSTATSSVTTTTSGGTTVSADGTLVTTTGTAAETGIFTPDGGVLRLEGADFTDTNAEVVIGARPSEDPFLNVARTNKPGFIFAECNAFPISGPGTLYDTDSLTVFWSWFAATPELVQEHIAAAQYSVRFWSPFNGVQTFSRVTVSDIVQREDGNYWVFYFVNLGPGFKHAQYAVNYEVSWSQAISDGFEQFGPGTANEKLDGACDFTVEENVFGADVPRPNPTTPLPE